MDKEAAVSADDVLKKVAELDPLIREHSAETERERHLATPVAEALRDIGCYRMFRPRSRGGLELDPVSAFRVIEELARIDSAAGWNIAIANASEPFGAWFSDAATEEVFGPAATVTAGAFNPPRRAVPTDGGYRLSGRTTFNSNSHAANWILGLGMVFDGDEPRMTDGNPEMLLTLFPMSDANRIDNWDTLGMRGTGSHDIEVKDIFVPVERAVPFVPMTEASSAYSGPLHRLSVWPPVACNAVSALGIAQAAIDDFIELAGTKAHAYTEKTVRDRSVAQLRLGQAQAKLGSARAFFHATFNNMWQHALDGGYLDMSQRADIQLATSNVVMAAAEAVDLIHSIAGTASIRNENNYPRYFRDIHVITQHAFVCETRLEAVGQIRLGLEPDWGFFHF